MAMQPSEGQLPHLVFGREPDREPERRRRRGYPLPPPTPPDRRERGDLIARETSAALEETQQARRAAGIDPNRLLVLEFQSINFDAREVLLDRFRANVVDERIEGRPPEVRLRTVVEFPTEASLQDFHREIALYQRESDETSVLPQGMRRLLLDGLQAVRRVTKEERTGKRLKAEGWPTTEPFFLDVDLWHPGQERDAVSLLQQFRDFCLRTGGRVTSEVRTSSLLLLKVHCSRALAEEILDLDIVARGDLPPRIAATLSRFFTPVIPPNSAMIPDETDPLACVVDSGVVAGHPLLANWVIEETDFDSGENTAADLNGHGTAVAGLVVYGDTAGCLERNAWQPKVRICSAKVLRSDPNPLDPKPRAIFPDENRVERTLEAAIRHFAGTRGCRVFNLSIGDDMDAYAGGRQFAWAEKLDELARELDVVIVVAVGNRYPEIPTTPQTRRELHEAVRSQTLSSDHRICNPATAALAITVGSLARNDGLPDRLRDAEPGSPARWPSPFTRTGPGYSYKQTASAVKPELVDFGGNLALQTLGTGTARWLEDLSLGEPTIQREIDGRFVGAETGTSYACPHVTHAAAIAERTLQLAYGVVPSANLIRALVASTAVPPSDEEWLDDEEIALRLVGYGISSSEHVAWSRQNNVRLVAMDQLEEERLHIYRLPLPAQFIETKGRKGITVALGYDPPVRASRKEYLARTMRFEVLQGLTPAEVQHYKERAEGGDAPPPPPGSELSLRPVKTAVQWSTLQVRRLIWRGKPKPRPASDGSNAFHVVVSCQQRFKTGEDPRQRYGLVINLWHDAEAIELYQALRNLVRVPVPRVRIQP